MIVFDIDCSQGHRFEAWFRNSAAFEQQAAEGEVACPFCGDAAVVKAPMAPHIATSSRGGRDHGQRQEGEGSESSSPAASGSPPLRHEALRVALEQLRRHVVSTCDDVGDRFPEEARRIHYGETDARGIYGEADVEAARELRDEGIEICPLPLLPRRNG
ncbi:MAG: DUF1178 family protein [Rhodospirillales bacterium]|nr:DUF1178 family protein [Rhodospirillales bacterium]